MDRCFCPFSLLCAALWNWKLPFQLHSQDLGVRRFHVSLYLQHFAAQTFHVAWYFATRNYLGLVYSYFCVYLGLALGLEKQNCKKQGSGAVEKKRSTEAEKWTSREARSRKAEKWRSKEAKKQRNINQRSRESKKAKTREAEKQRKGKETTRKMRKPESNDQLPWGSIGSGDLAERSS